VQSADDVRSVDAELCSIEASLNLRHRLCIIPWIETARGVMNASSICSASTRVAAVAFGAEDFSRDLQLPNEVLASRRFLPAVPCLTFRPSRCVMIGFQASTSHDALRTARSLVAIAAHACGVQPLDGPFVKFKDGYISFFADFLFKYRIVW
jgi:citrate lyase beta subunit